MRPSWRPGWGSGTAAAQQAGCDAGERPHSCTDYPVDLDVGELAPGHWLIMRSSCLKYDRHLWLCYAWVPGITGAQREESGGWLTVGYSADVLPDALNHEGSHGTGIGASSEARSEYSRPPREARYVWFGLFATEGHRVARLTDDLATDQVLADKWPSLGGMSARPHGRPIMNNHATRLGLTDVDGSGLEQ